MTEFGDALNCLRETEVGKKKVIADSPIRGILFRNGPKQFCILSYSGDALEFFRTKAEAIAAYNA